MDPQDLIKMLENRVAHNNRQRAEAFARGDVAAVHACEADNAKTEASLALLRSGLK